MKNLTFLLCCFTIINVVEAQEPAAGIFSLSANIGSPANKGSSAYNKTDQSYTIKGSGYNIWFERDEFHYLFNRIKGDFILTANFRFERKGVEAHRKTGWMLRSSTSEDSPHISATLHGYGLTLLQWRDNRGASMKNLENQIFARGSNYEVLQIERSGKLLAISHHREGFPGGGSTVYVLPLKGGKPRMVTR